MTSPLVSICIPCFDSEDFLPELFNGLLAQTYENVELFIVDDASVDNTFDVAGGYLSALRAKFRRVELSRNSQNQGALLTLDKMFSKVNGDFVSYLDADDYYHPAKIERSADFLASHLDFGAVHTNYYAIEDGFRVSSDHLKRALNISFVPQGWIFDYLLQRNVICSSTMMVRKDLLHRAYTFKVFNERRYLMGDYPAYLQLSRITQIGYVDEPLAYYRIRKNSMSHSTEPELRKRLNRAIARVQQHARLGLLKALPACDDQNEDSDK